MQQGRDRWLVLLAALGWLGFFAATLFIPPAQGGPSFSQHLISTTLSLTLLTALLMLGERPQWHPAVRWAMFIGGIALILGPYYLQGSLPFVKEPLVRSLSGLGLIGVALPVGYWIGDRMEKATNLIPLAVAMSMADIYSVFQGVTKRVTEDIGRYQREQAEVAQTAAAQAPSGQELAAAQEAMASVKAPLSDFIIAHFPVAGSGMTLPVLGIGDFIVLAFLFRAAWVHSISPRAMFFAGLLSTIAALASSALLAQYGPPIFARGIPALPFIALGTVGYLWLTQPRMRRLDRQERMMTLIVSALFGALLLASWLTPLLSPANGQGQL
jgi:hypothetical protein